MSIKTLLGLVTAIQKGQRERERERRRPGPKGGTTLGWAGMAY